MLSIYIDENILTLKKQAKKLESILAEKQIELSQLEHNLQLFSMEYNYRTSNLHIQKLNIDFEISKLIQKKLYKNPDAVDEILLNSKYSHTYITDEKLQETKNQYKHSHEDFLQLTDNINILDEDEQRQIKKIRKKLLMKYHPDKHHNNKELYSKATVITQKINQFYFDKNLPKLKELLNKNLRNNTIIIPNSIDELQFIIDNFSKSILLIEQSITNITNNDLYYLYSKYSDFINK